MKTSYRYSVLFPLIILVFCSLANAAPMVDIKLDLDRKILPAGQAETAIIKLSLQVPEVPKDIERPPVNLALVLDRSGSMSGQKIANARKAAKAALRRLDSRDLFSLIAYDHQVETLVPAQSAANSEWIESRIHNIVAGGNTALFSAVNQGAAEVRRNLSQPYVHRVILLSDGLANVGPSSPSDLARLGTALVKEGISVTTIGIGTDFNEDLMTQLAERSDGNHYFVESSRDLPRIFAAELGDVLSVAARDIQIEISCPEGVRPLRVIGREGSVYNNKVVIQLNQLYGGQEKYALIEVQVESGQEGQLKQLAHAQLKYDNALTNRHETKQAQASVRFSKRQEEVSRSASKQVQQAVVDNEIAVARDKALDLYNAGRKDEAVQELKKSSAKLKESSAALGFSDLAAEAEVLEADAVEFAAPALPSPRKKALRSESYKVRQQQKAY